MLNSTKQNIQVRKTEFYARGSGIKNWVECISPIVPIDEKRSQ